MTWLTRTKPHYIVRYSCGHIKTSCFCGHLVPRKRGTHRIQTTTGVVAEQCPSCRLLAERSTR